MNGYFRKIRSFFDKERLPSAEELLFEEDRKRLLGMLREMGDAVSAALKLVMEALEERNPEKAARVIAEDAHIDELEMELERQCLHVTALRRPVRNNLRFIVSLIKVAGDLERTGDQAANIAEKAILLGRTPLLKPLRDIPKMGSLAREMTEYALKSFEVGDAHLATEIYTMDDEVDSLYAKVFEDILLLVSQQGLFVKEDIEQVMNLVLIARFLERIGDQAVNVARRSYFMVTGKIMDQEMVPPQKV